MVSFCIQRIIIANAVLTFNAQNKRFGIKDIIAFIHAESGKIYVLTRLS